MSDLLNNILTSPVPDKHFILKLKGQQARRFDGWIEKADEYLLIKPVDGPLEKYEWDQVERIVVGFKAPEEPRILRGEEQ